MDLVLFNTKKIVYYISLEFQNSSSYFLFPVYLIPGLQGKAMYVIRVLLLELLYT